VKKRQKYPSFKAMYYYIKLLSLPGSQRTQEWEKKFFLNVVRAWEGQKKIGCKKGAWHCKGVFEKG
jgi:hypothetical protein